MGNYPIMIGEVPKCFGMRENYPMVIEGFRQCFRNKGEVSDGDRNATKGVSVQEILNDMYLILINVIHNQIIFILILKGQPT